MNNSPWSEGKFWPFLKRSQISKTGEAMPTEIGLHAFWVNLYLHEFSEPDFIFWPPWSEREIWPILKVAISPKWERACSPNLVCIHFGSTSTHINFLGQFHFLTSMDYSPWPEGKIWLFWRQKISPKLETSCPPKLACMHFGSTSTCMNFLSQFYFLTSMDYHGLKGKFGHF